jgi:hypothetical protein
MEVGKLIKEGSSLTRTDKILVALSLLKVVRDLS